MTGDLAEYAIDDHGDGLQIGRSYTVEMVDCCVRGTFEATLTGVRWVPSETAPGEVFPEALVWSNGVALEDWGQVMFTVTPASPEPALD